MHRKSFLTLLILFFILVPIVRPLVHIPSYTAYMQWIPFQVINLSTIRIYRLNFFLYLVPGVLYYGYIRNTRSDRPASRRIPFHFFLFFVICLATKMLNYVLQLGTFDISTVIVQTAAIFIGFLLAFVVDKFLLAKGNVN